MYYSKFTDEEILEVYNTMVRLSGKAERDVLDEIKLRGGIDIIQKACNDRQLIPNEIKRIESLVFTMVKNKISPEEIRGNITSEIMTTKELEPVIINAINRSKKYLDGKSFDHGTILLAIAGIFVSCIAGVLLWKYTLSETGQIDLVIIDAIVVIAAAIICLFTRKSKNNIVVFIAVFLAAVISILLGIWLK